MRTIVFASWDAEEVGVIGSAEWVEVRHHTYIIVILESFSSVLVRKTC